MLSVSDVSDADYYLRTGGSGCGVDPGDGATADYYMAQGEPPGEWLYVYRNDLGVSGEIHPEQPSGEAFRRVLNELQHPVTGEQLGRAPQRFASAEERLEKFKAKNPEATPEQISDAETRFAAKKSHAVHGWDMTFSVVKSISVAHAALEHEANRLEAAEQHEEARQRSAEAAEVVAAMRAGIDAAMKMAADEFGVTRRGAAGPDIDGVTTMRHVHDPNLQSAIFVHHTSRDRDPQLHAHVMVLNRILCEDGQWRALFASGLLKSKHQLDAVFTRVMEAELTRRLGWRFAMRPDGVAREVVGVSPEARDLFSARSRALSEKADEMLRAHMAEKGLKPEDVSALTRWRFNQKAVKESRKAKPAVVPSREEEVARWDREIAAELRQGLVDVLDEVDLAATRPPSSPDFEPDVVIAQALASLTEHKGVFKRSQLMKAISDFLPDMPGLDADEIVTLLRELTDAAESGNAVVSLAAPAPVAMPASLIDPVTGESVFEPPRGRKLTTRTHLSREDWLVGLLDRHGAPTLLDATARRVLDGRGLSNEQMDTAVSILTSDLFAQIVNAAAGTGKSRLMAALSDASADIWGQGLTGFSCSQNAAEVLAREGVHRAHNIAAFLTYRAREKRGEATDADRLRFAVPTGATVVVDEASMVSTPQAVALVRELDEVGVGRVVFIGDTAQVDAVDAGGGFALLAQQRTPHTLTQVRRFLEQWERDASTALRDGDITALHQYDTRGRIQGDAPEDIDRKVVDAFVADHREGLETVVVVSSGDKADELSSYIRQRLVEAGLVRSDGVAVAGRNVASVGDVVQTRLNHRGHGVVNREVWRVEDADLVDGSLTLRRAERDSSDKLTWGERRTLPADYVRDHVELAYASTVEAVQGRTTDTGHPVIDDQMGLSRAYPASTRGRLRNTMWVPVARPTRRDRESDAEYEARIPSALSVVVQAFEREDHTAAARTVIRAEQERATNLGRLGPEWQQLIAEHRADAHKEMLREVVGTDRHALFSDLSLDGLLHLMRSAESHGYDVRAELEAAYGKNRETGQVRLDGARSPASLLYALLDQRLHRDNVQPAHQVERAESYAERTPVGDGEEITYAREVAQVMDQRVTALGERAEEEPPAWATALLGPVPEDPFHRGEWREKVGVVVGYREQYGWGNAIDPVGPAPSRAEPEKRWAWTRATRALGVDVEREVVGASDGELANRVLAWRREQEWMPRNVDDDLRESHEAAAYLRLKISQAHTRREDSTEHTRHLKAMEARIRELEEVAGVRKVAVERTAPQRDRAQEAMAEMQRRVERDRAVAEREAAKRAAEERDRREAADCEARVHEAVGQRWRETWVRDAPLFGSERWAELEDDAPEKRAGLFNAALSWWRMGNPHDERAINERLETHEVDAGRELDGIVRFQEPRSIEDRVDDREPDMRAETVATWERGSDERPLTHRGLKKVRDGMDEEEVRASEPSSKPEVLAEVHRYTGPDMRGEAPEFGTPEYAEADDEAKKRSETRGALRWFGGGDDLDERAHRAEVAEEREAARQIAEATKAERQNYRGHREVAEARGEEPPPQREPINEEPPLELEPPQRPDTSWVRHAEAQRDEEKEERDVPQPREPEPEPAPKRDDLEEQLQRAREADQRMRQENEARAREEDARRREQQERDDAYRASRDREEVQR